MALRPADLAVPGDNRPPDIGPAPDPVACNCGSVRTFRVFPHTSHPKYDVWDPRWMAPEVNPCEECRADHEAREAARLLDRRQKWAGVDVKDRGWRWDATTVQRVGESDSAFRDRIMGADRIGVLRHNLDAAHDVAEWTPRRGFSVYVYGAVGSGKTVYASATATRLLDVGGGVVRRWRDADDLAATMIGGEDGGNPRPWLGPVKVERMLATSRRSVLGIGKPHNVLFCPHSEFYERVQLGWQRDRAPLAKIVDADGLILDDLGEIGSDPLRKEKQPPGAAEAIQKLIRARYAAGRHLIITSNVPLDDIEQGGRVVLSGVRAWWGDRVYSRLREMTEGHVWSLGGFDWRRGV